MINVQMVAVPKNIIIILRLRSPVLITLKCHRDNILQRLLMITSPDLQPPTQPNPNPRHQSSQPPESARSQSLGTEVLVSQLCDDNDEIKGFHDRFHLELVFAAFSWRIHGIQVLQHDALVPGIESSLIDCVRYDRIVCQHLICHTELLMRLHDRIEPRSPGIEILVDQRDAVKVHDIEEIQVERNR